MLETWGRIRSREAGGFAAFSFLLCNAVRPECMRRWFAFSSAALGLGIWCKEFFRPGVDVNPQLELKYRGLVQSTEEKTGKSVEGRRLPTGDSVVVRECRRRALFQFIVRSIISGGRISNGERCVFSLSDQSQGRLSVS